MSTIIRPVVTEKSGMLGEQNQYVFEVVKTASKNQIREEIMVLYPGVTIEAINTLIMPSKPKSRMSKRGFTKGRSSSWKKAIVTLKEGDKIDFFAEI